ncbi:MAG TPA: hypothetical protein VHX88_12715 [Solirubrobacteraceae bacterium]|jgi:hypothetical protein|nr:hypothetical protein [Solirubrobacteraceae bacterium]
MSAEPHHIRRVQLPGGKVIEVVYLDSAPVTEPAPAAVSASPAPAAAPTPAPKPARRELHVCPRCQSKLVHPIDWSEAGRDRWEVLLRCPECEWTQTGIFEQAVVDDFDRELDEGMEVLVRDLQHLTHANMAEQVERFVAALHRDQILPSDF